MKRILGLTIAFMLLIGMASIGTWAYFSDVETSTSERNLR
jgi:predicted ribosomally synthesized peptide with SipW-like signal peptide